MNKQEFFQSKQFKSGVIALAIIFLCLASFKAGMIIGYRKAGFSFRWSDNYHRNFVGPFDGNPGRQLPVRGMGGMMRPFDDRMFMQSGGVAGFILTINNQKLTVENPFGEEQSVLVSDKTVVKKFRENIKASDLKPDDFVTVVGEPNKNGEIEARLIRVMPGDFPGAPTLKTNATNTASSTILKK
ncbi:hypothetical protein HGA64_04505 [Candidatus Falkowbacteria bacterium]|nr:hypothetical protein [Candidatus Falkowbacteria bacterium]